MIDVNGVIAKNNNAEITEKEYDSIMDDFLELLENKGYCFGGGFNHLSEDEIE